MSGRNARGASASDLLLDSDVCIDHLRGARPLTAAADGAFYSLITRCELFAGREAEERIRAFLDRFNEMRVDRDIAERAGRLRRVFSLRTPDAIIAATALAHGLVLVSRNQRDFAKVDGLRLGTLDHIV